MEGPALSRLVGSMCLKSVSEPSTADTSDPLGVLARAVPLGGHGHGRASNTRSVLSVQERLGHASIAITLDRYSYLRDGTDRDAA